MYKPSYSPTHVQPKSNPAPTPNRIFSPFLTFVTQILCFHVFRDVK